MTALSEEQVREEREEFVRRGLATWAAEYPRLITEALALLDAGRKDRERVDWYEEQHTLHGAVEVLYVVDGYKLTITHDGNPVREVEAPTLRAAIDQARGA